MPNVLLHPEVMRTFFIKHNAVVNSTAGGVLCFIDVAEDVAYLETSPGFDMEALVAWETIIRRYGYEVMGEDEAPAEVFEDGRVRHWLAQTYFPEEANSDNEKEVAAVS